MKKLLIALSVILFTLTGCLNKYPDGSLILNPYVVNDNSTINPYVVNDNSTINPYVVVIDSCEYIVWGYKMSHKGNCKFCEKRHQKEYEAFLENIIIELY